MLLVDFDDVPVALVPWPEDDDALDVLAVTGRPRLLLVAAGAEPPEVRDPLEDWIRVPADDRDVEVRARRLARIATARRSPANGAGRAARPPMTTAPGGRRHA